MPRVFFPLLSIYCFDAVSIGYHMAYIRNKGYPIYVLELVGVRCLKNKQSVVPSWHQELILFYLFGKREMSADLYTLCQWRHLSLVFIWRIHFYSIHLIDISVSLKWHDNFTPKKEEENEKNQMPHRDSLRFFIVSRVFIRSNCRTTWINCIRLSRAFRSLSVFYQRTRIAAKCFKKQFLLNWILFLSSSFSVTLWKRMKMGTNFDCNI